MGRNKREKMKRREARLKRRRARRAQGAATAPITRHATQGTAADACPHCGKPTHDTTDIIIHFPTAVDEVPPDLDERYDTIVERVIDDTVHRWLCLKSASEGEREEIRARAAGYVPIQSEPEPLVHCAACEEALAANRAGWCSECQAFVFASACKWATEDVDGENIVDLMCPKCSGGRWCCEFYEDDSAALEGITVTRADVARCAAAGHAHDIAECAKPDHWPAARQSSPPPERRSRPLRRRGALPASGS